MRDGIAHGHAGAQRESVALQERLLERPEFRSYARGPVTTSFFVK